MKTAKSLLSVFPEYYLIALVLLAGYTPPFSLNIFSVGLAVLFVLQLFFKNRISGMVIALLFALANIYMLGALLSEFREAEQMSNHSWQLIAVGIPLIALNLTIAGFMFYKYYNRSPHGSQLASNPA